MGKKRLPTIVSEDEFVKIIKKTKNLHHKIAFLLAFGSGLRISEVLNLEKSDINFEEKRIFIRQGKGGKDRIVPLPKGWKTTYNSVLPLKDKLGIRALQKGFKTSCNRAGITDYKPDIHFHCLRHGFASRMANNGVPIHHIRTLMGHSNISTTNVYLELNPVQALKSYEEYF